MQNRFFNSKVVLAITILNGFMLPVLSLRCKMFHLERAFQTSHAVFEDDNIYLFIYYYHFFLCKLCRNNLEV